MTNINIDNISLCAPGSAEDRSVFEHLKEREDVVKEICKRFLIALRELDTDPSEPKSTYLKANAFVQILAGLDISLQLVKVKEEEREFRLYLDIPGRDPIDLTRPRQTA